MLIPLAPLHAIAACRGDGLHPELISPLERGADALVHCIRRVENVMRTGQQGPCRALVQRLLG
jgi:hypothetical protein